jgi:HK97 family phage portal protein
MGLFSRKTEDRTLSATDVAPAPLYLAGEQPLDVSQFNCLRVADAYACVRVLADTISTLPLHAYRRTDAGRVRAGDDTRIVRLLARPAPGSTICDLLSQIVVSLNITGDAFVAKYRSEGEIVQLGLLDPATVDVELRGRRIVYRLMAPGSEHGPEDVLHIKAMPGIDGLRGLSPVTQARLALELSSKLQASARTYFRNGSRPSGVLSLTGPQSEGTVEAIRERWDGRHGGTENLHRVAVLSGEAKFQAVAFSAEDSQFLGQRELSAREVCRIFRVPAWAVDAATGDSLTYANVGQQSRALIDYSLRPWLVRAERAISGDPDLCPGGTYVQFELDALLRGDADTRSQIYQRALGDGTHPAWMTVDEVRALEDLTPMEERTP